MALVTLVSGFWLYWRDFHRFHPGPGASPAEQHYDLAVEYQGSYNRTIAHFVKSLNDNTPFETAPEDNLETLRLMEDCYRLSGWEAAQ